MAESNLAYDFDRFDRQARQRAKEEKKPAQPKYRVVYGATNADLAGADILLVAPDSEKAEAIRQRKTRLLKIVASCLSLMLMFGIVIHNQASLNEVNAQIAKTARQIETLKAEHQIKRVELDKRLSLKSAQEIAETELGMVELDEAQVQYVMLEHSDGNASKRSGDGLLENVERALDDAYAYLSGN